MLGNLRMAIGLMTCAAACTAMGDVTRVVIHDPLARPVVTTDGNVSIGLFRPTLVLQDYPPVGVEVIENSVRIGFYFDSGVIRGGIVGNDLPFPSFPLQSPSLFADGALELLGMELDSAGTWFSPRYDSISDIATPATLSQVNEFGNFQIQSFADGAMAYIGYADADRTRFGYIQIQRQSLTDWTLVGHAYGDLGEVVVVENLIPAPGMLGLAVASFLALPRRRTRI